MKWNDIEEIMKMILMTEWYWNNDDKWPMNINDQSIEEMASNRWPVTEVLSGRVTNDQ